MINLFDFVPLATLHFSILRHHKMSDFAKFLANFRLLPVTIAALKQHHPGGKVGVVLGWPTRSILANSFFTMQIQ